MDWFQQLREALAPFYPPGGPLDVVGYLRGSANPVDWWKMIQGGSEQMIILGSVPPTPQEWAAAGVAQRPGGVQTIRINDLSSFMISYGGLMVSRPWGNISTAFPNYESTIGQFKRAVAKSIADKSTLVAAMNRAIYMIQSRLTEASEDHKAQEGLLTGSQGDFSGFFGYWTNHLFNSDIPPQQIWSECFSELAHARSTLRERNFVESGKAIIRARYALLEATGIYYRWKAGIEGAGTQMQITIGVAAVALLFAAAVATAATAAAVPAAAVATEGTSATATIGRLTSLVAHGDNLLLRVAATAPEGVTAPSAAAYEQALVEIGQETEQLLRMTM